LPFFAMLARMLLRLDDSGITHHMNEPSTSPRESA
jgi:hypothetical protein